MSPLLGQDRTMTSESIGKRFVFSGLVAKFFYFCVLLTFGLITWLFINKYIEDFAPVVPMEIPFGIKSNQNMSMAANLKVTHKIDQMKRELNDSTLNNETMYPANRIGRYIWLDPNLCKSSSRINIIIIVHTAPSHFKKRQRIRETFGNQHLFQPFQIRVAFLLGNALNRNLKSVMWLEYLQYNDTVMGDFIDSYHNLSLKGVMGYHWVSQYCPNSDIVLKIDDDVLVNMFKLLYSFLPHMLGKTKSIFCNLWYKGTMPILREGKWKVEPHLFSTRDIFPYDYCSGFVVLMTSDLMGPMYEAAKITPFFWIDDIYLFGMLPLVVGDVTYYNYALDRNVTFNERVAIRCSLLHGQKCPMYATLISDFSYWAYWNIIMKTYASPVWNVKRKFVN